MSKLEKLLLVKDHVMEGYQNGLTLKALAVAHDVSVSTVRRCLLINNVSLRNRGRPKGGNHATKQSVNEPNPI